MLNTFWYIYSTYCIIFLEPLISKHFYYWLQDYLYDTLVWINVFSFEFERFRKFRFSFKRVKRIRFLHVQREEMSIKKPPPVMLSNFSTPRLLVIGTSFSRNWELDCRIVSFIPQIESAPKTSVFPFEVRSRINICIPRTARASDIFN